MCSGCPRGAGWRSAGERADAPGRPRAGHVDGRRFCGVPGHAHGRAVHDDDGRVAGDDFDALCGEVHHVRGGVAGRTGTGTGTGGARRYGEGRRRRDGGDVPSGRDAEGRRPRQRALANDGVTGPGAAARQKALADWLQSPYSRAGDGSFIATLNTAAGTTLTDWSQLSAADQTAVRSVAAAVSATPPATTPTPTPAPPTPASTSTPPSAPDPASTVAADVADAAGSLLLPGFAADAPVVNGAIYEVVPILERCPLWQRLGSALTRRATCSSPTRRRRGATTRRAGARRAGRPPPGGTGAAIRRGRARRRRRRPGRRARR